MGDNFDCNLEILELTAGGGGDGGEDEFKPKYFFRKCFSQPKWGNATFHQIRT